MRAKTLLIAFIMVFTVLFSLTLSWARGGIVDRQRKQIQRIRGGVRSGEVTRKESKKLGREQRRIRQAMKNARADGRVNFRERQRIHRLQDRAGKHIYLAKHNRAKRYWLKRHHGHKYLGHWRGYHHNRLHRRYRPPYSGYHIEGGYADPYYSFSWSIGWW
jgi:hypothetical protein